MATTEIRQIIKAALAKEQATHQLADKLGQRLPELDTALILPEKKPLLALMTFVTDYIESVPGCLNLVSAMSKQLGFQAYAAPFIQLAEDYFLQPAAAATARDTLEDLLDEAFLAHRVLEEVNDHHIRHTRQPLLPVDMTEANIIVHHLLGDSLATRLEQRVQHTASQLWAQQGVWTGLRNVRGSEDAPTMNVFYSEQLGDPVQHIRLRLGS
tara:strand:- start:215711 stop:216346 length:636 start_codon:yes stop_codon:yes gene_type:complete